ncbi:hypothetical protein [Mesorhizobium sp.]|uniref:hypothetical protein n=1 Tax=Mesorhizobium sp. TaxID=1871066 RepID=UPI003BADBC79
MAVEIVRRVYAGKVFQTAKSLRCVILELRFKCLPANEKTRLKRPGLKKISSETG